MLLCSVQPTSIALLSSVLPEVAYFPGLGFLSFSSTGSRVLGQRASYLNSLSKPREVIGDIGLYKHN